MRTRSTLLFLLLSPVIIRGQGQFNHQVSARWGSNLNDMASAVAIAPDGSMLLAGTFTNSIDMDPGPNETMFTATPLGSGQPSEDYFAVKLNADGTLAWGFTVGNTGTEVAGGVTFDTNGDALLACSFKGVTDIDPGPAELLTPATANHTAVLRIDGQSGALLGHFILSSPVGQFSASAHTTFGIEAAPDGGFAIHGGFGDNLDLDHGPGAGVVNSNGGFDAFVAKYAADMSYEWGFGLGGTGNFTDRTTDIRFDADGALYVGGFFNAGTDFDPGPAQAVIPPASSGRDVCVARYGTDGAFAWMARMVSPSSSDGLYGLEVAQGEVLLIGGYETSVDVDPGAATHLLTPTSNTQGTYLVKLLATTGAFASAAQFDQFIEPVGGAAPTNHRRSVALAGADHFVFAGELFFGTYDMQIGPGVTDLQPNNGVRDIVLARYAWSDFALSGAIRIGGTTGSDECHAITSNASGQILIGGGFRSSVLNVAAQGPAVNLSNAGNAGIADAFCARYVWSASTTGIAEANSATIIAFPNPFVSTITLNGPAVGFSQVRVFDAAGRVAAEASGSLPLSLELGALRAGIYTAHVTSRNGPAVFRLVKE